VTAVQLSLPACVLPGCRNPVGRLGDPCGDCQREFGPMLRPTGQMLTEDDMAAQIEERDSYVHRAYALQRLIREGR